MPEQDDDHIAALAAGVKSGSIIAAAGCGKTEQIARATGHSNGRRLILTHTHAGVDALRSRLDQLKVPKDKYRLDTIAGWCLRYAASFPKHSGLQYNARPTGSEWNAVYESATNLIHSGAVSAMLVSSYGGVFVDEYQDCTSLQHSAIKALMPHLPVCIFGDHLQAIFDFKDQMPVDWETEVFPVFAKKAELITPWRWKNAGNAELAQWLAAVRLTLENGGAIDLKTRPQCVTWQPLPPDAGLARIRTIAACKTMLGTIGDGRLVVIGDPANVNSRAQLAKTLAKFGFSNIEPVDCKTLSAFAKKLETAEGMDRLNVLMDFICACMSGAEKKPFLDAVASRAAGGKLGTAKFGDLITVGLALAQSDGDKELLSLMLGFHDRDGCHLYRREMFYALCSALKINLARQDADLAEALWEVQTKIRHAGRKIPTRGIGSTLLVKGLQFEHAVIIHSKNMSAKDWYVALTRATDSLIILSPSETITPGQ